VIYGVEARAVMVLPLSSRELHKLCPWFQPKKLAFLYLCACCFYTVCV